MVPLFEDVEQAISDLKKLCKRGLRTVVWGSDFPHIRSVGVEAQEKLAELLEGVPGQDQQKIVGGNAAEVRGL